MTNEIKINMSAKEIIMQYFPIADAGRLWTKDDQHGVVLDDGVVTMLDVEGYPRTRKPSYEDFAHMLQISHNTVDDIASLMDS